MNGLSVVHIELWCSNIIKRKRAESSSLILAGMKETLMRCTLESVFEFVRISRQVQGWWLGGGGDTSA